MTEYNQPFEHLVDKYCALGPVAECVATIERYVEADVQHVTLIPAVPSAATMDQLRQISAELFSRFRS